MERYIGAIFAACLAAGVALASSVGALCACPFCSATSQTFSEELATMDVAVIARLVKLPPPSSKPGDDIQKATFEVTQIVKGEGLVKAKEKIDTLYFGDGAIGKSFLVMGISPPATADQASFAPATRLRACATTAGSKRPRRADS